MIMLLGKVSAQDFFKGVMRRIPGDKKSLYFDHGIFVKGATNEKKAFLLRAMRHSFSKTSSIERVVLDFEGAEVPKIYAHMTRGAKTLFIDFFSTKILPGFKSFGKSHYIEEFRVFPLDDQLLSLELHLNIHGNLDIFYLKKPGRMVIDIKEY